MAVESTVICGMYRKPKKGFELLKINRNLLTRHQITLDMMAEIDLQTLN